MPAIDNVFGKGAIHISDQNKLTPVTTLCGQALDKESVRYLEVRENFDNATCKVCRKSFFDEDWNAAGGGNQESEPLIIKTPIETAIENDQAASQTGGNRLFANMTPIVNKHDKQEGDQANGGT